MRILFVCTGNTCRSPMAEALANQYIKDNNISDITVSSCGLFAQKGQPISSNSVEALAQLGIDISSKKSRRIKPIDLTDSDIIAVMSPEHMEILSQAGVPTSRMVLLGGGIYDPYGQDIETYIACRDQIKDAVCSLFERIKSNNTGNNDE